MTWQPIETAPRDGTYILVWNGKHVVHASNRWDSDSEWTYEPTCSECRDSISPPPTHWTPLPEPPHAR